MWWPAREAAQALLCASRCPGQRHAALSHTKGRRGNPCQRTEVLHTEAECATVGHTPETKVDVPVK